MLVLTRKVDEVVNIYVGDRRISILVCGLGNSKVSLGIDAAKDIDIKRQEIDERHNPS